MQGKQITMGESTPEYEAFVAKFKPKLTTDDCYTPDNVYEAVKAWVFKRYALPEGTPVIRPFWPGGDYQAQEYPEGSVVIDNPPFSILSEIERFFLANGVRFFLFAPGRSIFKPYSGLKYVCASAGIVYHNGAEVLTGFATNMGEYLIETAPDLYAAIKAANAENVAAARKELPKYEYPMEVVTAARINWLSAHGVEYRVREKDARFVRKLDAMDGKSIFGNGFLVCPRAAAERAAAERAAAERAAAERAAAVRWRLSEREQEIVAALGRD